MLFGLSLQWNACFYMFDFICITCDFYRLCSQINDDDDDDDDDDDHHHHHPTQSQFDQGHFNKPSQCHIVTVSAYLFLKVTTLIHAVHGVLILLLQGSRAVSDK